ncbi:F-box/kelch-repeat protein At3g23880-like [Euphorbia lathyris]|uniref:F-box/kelch-repeat protein At3g23880-like n=1 Tax=Euphorbia lathyris TaxID=212925 RepID=UPI0033135941
MANLPQEMVMEILLWLPVKSLVRFRCVCKSFCAMIESQSFINSHFRRSSENRIHCKLIELGVHMTDDDDRLKIYGLDFDDDFQAELVLDKLYPSTLYLRFFSYCNGLVLLFLDKLCIWNPSTRQYRMLPAFPLKHIPNLSFALGYDSTVDDYKVVVIISNKGCGISQVWIFELRLSCWRRIDDFPYVVYDSIDDGGNGDCFLDGAVHFICHDAGYGHGDTNIIVAFDVAKETFSKVRAPVQTEGIPIRLHILRQCLSVSVWSLTKRQHVDIYVRKKDGAAFTWTRLYSITKQQSYAKSFVPFAEGRVAFSEEGDTVFLSSMGKLLSYDFKEQSFRVITSKHLDIFKEKRLQEFVNKNANYLDLFSCTETLVSVLGKVHTSRRRKRKKGLEEVRDIFI